MITNEMANLIREADVEVLLDDGLFVITNLDKFAALIASAEREACAKVCYLEAEFVPDPIDRERIYLCADKIRERGNT